MNKKILLSLGTLASVVTPVVATVSCGKTLPPTEENASLSAFIKGDLAKKVQMTWLEKAVSNLYPSLELDKVTNNFGDHKIIDIAHANNTEILEMTKKHLVINSKGNPNITRSSVVAIQREFRDKISKAQLIKTGIQKEHRSGFKIVQTTNANITADDEISYEGLNLLFNTEATGIKEKVYRELIVKKYLELNKTSVSKVFKKENENRNLSFWEQKISNDNFVLIKELMEKKYFAKWDISPTFASNMTGQFTGEVPFADMIAKITKAYTPTSGSAVTDGVFTQFIDYSTKNTNYSKNEFDLSPASGTALASYENLIGYKGIESQSPTGQGILSFNRNNASGDTTDHFMEATTEQKWEGFIEPEHQKTLISSGNIKYRKDATSPVHLTYLKGLMPIYKTIGSGATTTKEYALGANLLAHKEDLIRFAAVKNTNLFAKAFKYFRADRGTAAADKAIILTLKDDTNNVIKQELENKNIWAYFEKYTEEDK